MSPIDLSTSMLLGKGSSRLCYLHPEDPGQCIKVTYTENPGVSAEELKHYRRLIRKGISWEMMARTFGTVDTTLGPGTLFSLARDHDGSISKTLDHYLASRERTPGKSELACMFSNLKNYLLRECIVVREIKAENLVYQRTAPGKGKLILIDGVGNNQLIPLANHLKPLARRMIRKKWANFERYLHEDYPDNHVVLEALRMHQ